MGSNYDILFMYGRNQSHDTALEFNDALGLIRSNGVVQYGPKPGDA